MLSKKHNIIDISEVYADKALFSPKVGDVILYRGKHFLTREQDPGPHSCDGCACKRFGLFCSHVNCENPNLIFKKL